MMSFFPRPRVWWRSAENAVSLPYPPLRATAVDVFVVTLDMLALSSSFGNEFGEKDDEDEKDEDDEEDEEDELAGAENFGVMAASVWLFFASGADTS
jgi:hypothetical protein